jgi:hypothetical protein
MPRKLHDLRYPSTRMKRGSWAPLLCLAMATVSLPVLAQQRPGGEATQPLTEDQAKAQQHFHRAKELYLAGSYREAIAELEVARRLDPKAKDLVMNLGIVHEKLGKFDEALGYFKSYLEMEGVTAAERAKAEGMIKRVEGAKREVPTPAASASATPSPSSSSAPALPPGGTDTPSRGRIDTLTVVAGSIAAVGLLGGGGLGVYALTSKPDDFVTGRDGSYSTLRQQTEDAHTLAIVADVGLGIGVVATVVTALLYFGRTKDPAPSRTGVAGHVSAAPKAGGGVFLLGGAF